MLKSAINNFLLSICVILITSSHTLAQESEVTFDNKSGEAALVKLVGPTYQDVEVSVGGSTSVNVSPGEYYIKVRYGIPGRYRYAKGEEFKVIETATTRSNTTITLHKVIGGNYDTGSIDKHEFDEEKAPMMEGDATNKKIKTLLVCGLLIQQNGKPAENIKVYLQKAFFPHKDRTTVRTMFTTDEQGKLSMPFGITDKLGKFSIEFEIEDYHQDFAISLHSGRAGLDFPVIKLVEIDQQSLNKDFKVIKQLGQVSLPKNLPIIHFEKGIY